MRILKMETNYNRNLFFHKYDFIKVETYSESIENDVINIYPDINFQTFLGFGGAFTESSGFAYSKLPKDKKEAFIDDYFSSKGINYYFGRLPIGSSDFSLESYSYSNQKDLKDFSINPDKKYILPLVEAAKKLNNSISFLASPWSPPSFMKSNKSLLLGGKLLDNYKQAYADYLSKYILSYKEQGITIKYITVQNEPLAVQTWESCTFSAKEEIDFIVNYLYPTFKKNNITTKILIWDQNKEKLLNRVSSELISDKAKNIVAGFAYHWYTGDHFENLSLLHNKYPDKLLIHTEGCTGFSNFNSKDELHNAELYAHDILGDLNHGTNAYIDWNLILDHNGGPNHKSNYCNSPIMLNKQNNDYIKTLTYYYIGQFSKFIKPNAVRIGFSKFTDEIEVTGFKNKDNSIAVILFNKNDYNKEYNLCISDKVIHDNLDKHAIVSYLIEF